jgi:isopenicillin-N N-acyltransferase-like protein
MYATTAASLVPWASIFNATNFKNIVMTKYINGLIYFILGTIVLLPSQRLFSQSIGHKVSHKKNVPVIELTGNGYQRGLQHGKALKNEIAEVFKKWKENIENISKQNADSIIDQFYNATNFVPTIKKWTPEIYDELKGISQSSGQSFKDIFCFQLVDEFWVYIDKLKNTQNHHCSGIGVAATNNHPTYIAQNMDLENYMNGYQILLHINANHNEPEQYILSCAGLVALNGLNSKSIGVCVNTLMELKASNDGLPVVCVIRGILSKKDGESALKFVQTIKHASGQNYIIGTRDSVYDFEASAGKVVRFLPNKDNYSLVYHTNHAIANDNIKPWYKERHKQILSGELKKHNSVIRFSSLKQRLNLSTTNISEAVIKETLRSKDDLLHPICLAHKNGDAIFTFSSVVLTLSKNPSIQLTNASPDQSEYIMHTFKDK